MKPKEKQEINQIYYLIGIVFWIATAILFNKSYPYYLFIPITLGIGCYPIYFLIKGRK